ncbi:MAG TPA: CheR family methyltransferase, partial [Pyrinomonadaceae bacterium]|nr:CheR family methyltransferase [Pyrinomonadaceae bacterium]
MAEKKTKPSKKKAPPPVDDDFLIVGLGASAGGIHALKEFFSHVRSDSNMAYVVILHLSPEHDSKLAEVLQYVSPIPVTQVHAREKIHPNHVYVIPPNRNLEMTDGHVTPTAMIGLEERRSPVDLFFRTLAETNDARAVSVILSGTGSDGSIGIKIIKENGGVSIAQDPAEAEYKDMPKNAVATGMVDHVLPVTAIPSKIIAYRDHRATVRIPEPTKSITPTDEQALRDVFTQLRMRTGHDFSNYKRGTMLRRLERRIGLKELSGLPAYAEYMRDHSEEAVALMKDLLISVTHFFRDPKTIEAFERLVLPRVFERKSENQSVRVWVAGCATGEEAYTMAMLLCEAAAKSSTAYPLQVFATDLDANAIAVAREGYYTEAEVADVSTERLQRFFQKEADGYRVRRELREMVLFAVHNVIKDPPFSHLDLVSCRNLLIYLNRTAQARLLEVMHFALNPESYLFLGASESIEGSNDLYAVVDNDHHIYQTRPVPTRLKLPIPDLNFKPTLPTIVEKGRTVQEVRAMERLSYANMHQRLLEQFGPPSVVVNQEYDIVHLSERAGVYLQMQGGQPSQNLLQLVRPELRMELRTALYQAVQTRTHVEVPGLKVSTDLGIHVINIIVRPVLDAEDANRGFILVLFEQQDMAPAPPPVRR